MEYIGIIAGLIGLYIAYATDTRKKDLVKEENKEAQGILENDKKCNTDDSILSIKEKSEYVMEKNARKEIKKLIEELNSSTNIACISGKKGRSYQYDGRNADEIINKIANSINSEMQTIREKEYKGHLISHGGCLSCKVPMIESVGSCYDCTYFNWTGGGEMDDIKCEDKSERYSMEDYNINTAVKTKGDILNEL